MRGEAEPGELAKWTERRKSAERDVELEVEEDHNATTGRTNQERNVDLESAAQQEEEGRNTYELKKEMEAQQAAEEWFECEWWMPPDTPYHPNSSKELLLE
ncbi:hypothetical protein NDU88_004337 [Pleurodeles waltl]|uniref:Uncharacterized protein n=1 Tax=Pleurodeles waltl TaxID=8319 RepID=A0AAV7L8G1_PLEWA|nr:hypothetical protein NDU88_004337 [Pleurodeles waltl]